MPIGMPSYIGAPNSICLPTCRFGRYVGAGASGLHHVRTSVTEARHPKTYTKSTPFKTLHKASDASESAKLPSCRSISMVSIISTHPVPHSKQSTDSSKHYESTVPACVKPHKRHGRCGAKQQKARQYQASPSVAVRHFCWMSQAEKNGSRNPPNPFTPINPIHPAGPKTFLLRASGGLQSLVCLGTSVLLIIFRLEAALKSLAIDS